MRIRDDDEREKGQNPPSNVVRLPRDWLGPREDLVPLRTTLPPPADEPDAAVLPFPATSLTHDDFWSGEPDAIPDPVLAPEPSGPPGRSDPTGLPGLPNRVTSDPDDASDAPVSRKAERAPVAGATPATAALDGPPADVAEGRAASPWDGARWSLRIAVIAVASVLSVVGATLARGGRAEHVVHRLAASHPAARAGDAARTREIAATPRSPVTYPPSLRATKPALAWRPARHAGGHVAAELTSSRTRAHAKSRPTRSRVKSTPAAASARVTTVEAPAVAPVTGAVSALGTSVERHTSSSAAATGASYSAPATTATPYHSVTSPSSARTTTTTTSSSSHRSGPVGPGAPFAPGQLG